MSDIKNWADDAALNIETSPNGWPEGMPPSDVNNSAREMMAAIRRSYVRQPWYAPGGTIIRASANTITIADDSKVTNYANFYTVGARVRIETTGDYVTGYVVSSLYEDPTSTITFNLDAGADLPATITDVYVGLSPEDVQGVAGPNLLGCVLGFSSASDKIGAGLLLANGEKFNPSLYPDLAQLYYVAENTYKYGQELVGDVYWPLMPVIKPDEMSPIMINSRPPEWSSAETTAMTSPFTAPSDGVVSFMLPARMVGYIQIGDKRYDFDYNYNYTQFTLFSTNVKEGTIISFSGVSSADFLTNGSDTDAGNFSDLYGVVVAYGGVVSSGLADVTELEAFCTAERVRAENAADAASRSADDASGYAVAASGHSTAASSSATLAQQWATKTDGLVASTDYSAKYYANQSSASASNASDSADLAHAWATSSTVVESGQYGASYYALRAANYASGAETARDTARNWATKTDGPVADSNYSAKWYANQAISSATAASNSAAQAAAIVAQLGTVLTYKGSVATYADLPATGNKTGDVWNVLADGKNYAWDGTGWDDFGGAVTVALSACTDVSLTSLTDGQVLIWDSVAQKWKNGTVDALPSQTGNAGKSLYTDGEDASWKVTRDPNTYRSLSSAQKTTLLDNGTYNGEEVTSGEIFTTEDGAFKKYTKEPVVQPDTVDLGFNTGSDTLSTQKFNNGAFVLTYARGSEKNYFLSDRGATWTEIAPGVTSSKKIAYTATINGIEYGYFMKFAYGNITVRKTVDGVNFDAEVQVSLPFWADPSQEGKMTAFNSMGKVCIYWFDKYYGTPQQRFVYAKDPESTWSEVTMPDSDTYWVLPFDDEVRIVNKNNYKIFSSTDLSQGFTDTGKVLPETNNMVGNPLGLFVVNGIVYINTATGLLYSADRGETFTQTSLSGTYWAVIYVPEQQAYVAISSQKNGKYYVSENGKDDWVEKEATAGTSIYNDILNNPNGCLFTDGAKVYTVGSYGTGSTRINVGIDWDRSLTSLSYNKDEVDALIGGGGAGSLEDIAEAGDGIKFVTGYENFFIIGSGCTVTDGVATGFDWYNTKTGIGTDYQPAVNNNTWEFVIKATTAASMYSVGEFLTGARNGVDCQIPVIGTANGHFVMYLTSNGSSWDIASGVEGSYSVQSSTTYWIKVSFDGSKYVLAYSTDGTTFTDDITITSSTPMYKPTTGYLGLGICAYNSATNSVYWRGSIDLKETYFKIGDNIDWQPYSSVDKPAITADILLRDSAPVNNTTAGFLGQLYIDKTNKQAYICVEANEGSSTYTWKQITS